MSKKQQRSLPRKWIINIILILLLGVLFGIHAHRIEKNENDIKMTQALEVFLRLDDLAHQGISEGWERWKIYSGAEAEFEEIDENFHAAATLKEKFERAEKLDIFFNKLDINIHNTPEALKTPESIARDKIYHQIDELFHQTIDNSTLRDIQEAKSIEVFTKIYEISLEKYKEISAIQNPQTAEMDKEFPKMEEAYQKAKTLHQKYLIIKDFVAFMEKGHDMAKNLGYSTVEEDEEFYELMNEFYKTKPW